jgi:hypothetical protein
MLQEYLAQRERPLFSSTLELSLREQPVSATGEHSPLDTPPIEVLPDHRYGRRSAVLSSCRKTSPP